MASASSADFVLPLAAERELELLPVCIAAVPPQKVATLVKAVAVALGSPPELQHLRRVRQPGSGVAGQRIPKKAPEVLQVLLWAGSSEEQDRIPASLAAALVELEIRVIQSAVPRHPPVTLAQHERWNRVWPLAFHPSAAVRALTPWAPEEPPTAAELEWMTAQMRIAIAVAEQAVLVGNRPVGAVVSEPLGEVLAACSDGAGYGFPLSEGDAIPNGTGGAAYSCCSSGAAASVPNGAHACGLHHPLQHAVMQCIELVAEAARRRRTGAAATDISTLVGCKRGAGTISALNGASENRPSQHGLSKNSAPACLGGVATSLKICSGGAEAGQDALGGGCGGCAGEENAGQDALAGSGEGMSGAGIRCQGGSRESGSGAGGSGGCVSAEAGQDALGGGCGGCAGEENAGRTCAGVSNAGSCGACGSGGSGAGVRGKGGDGGCIRCGGGNDGSGGDGSGAGGSEVGISYEDISGAGGSYADDGCLASAAPSAPACGASADDLYLCSRCDVFITVEPCAMCAMALVHSRIRRLVYALPAAEGALGSKYRLHTIPSINHHYQVVRGFLSEEAGQRLERAGMGARQGTDRMAG